MSRTYPVVRPVAGSANLTGLFAGTGLMFSGVVIAVIGFVIAHPAPTVDARDVAILIDRSDSMEDGRGSSCKAAEVLADRAFKLNNVAAASHVQMFMTGNGVGQRMPALGGSIRVPLLEGGELSGQDDANRRLSTAQAVSQCVAGISQLTTSPILSSVTGVLEQMQREWGCSSSHACTLLVRSDLVETEDAAVKAAIHASGKRRAAFIAGLPVLTTNGIETRVCGTGESTEKITASDAAAIEATWAHLLPGVVMSPVCEAR